MLDFRIETFLCVCRNMNFTSAAEELHITQPAVSQHIQFLEKYYGVSLFERNGKKILLTPAGETLLHAMIVIRNDENAVSKRMKNVLERKKILNIGVTMTIGEFIISKPISKYLKNHPETDINIRFGNTAHLCDELLSGSLDFALVEGNFDFELFDMLVLKSEKYIPVCSVNHIFDKEVRCLSDLLSQRLIVRESGSGTRDILEKSLQIKNINITDFAHCVQVDNTQLIVNLLKEDCGISFLYKAAVEKEIKNSTLKEIKLNDFDMEHNFTFIWNKGSVFSQEYKNICNELKKTEGSDNV